MQHLDLLMQSNAFQNLKTTHAYLFYADDSFAIEGLSRLQAAKILCNNPNAPCTKCDSCLLVLDNKHSDVILLQKEKIGTVDIEQILDSILVTPFGKFKIYIIPNLDASTPQAQNKLLKSIEEPPSSVKFIFGACNIDGVLPTIKSRCLLYELRPFAIRDIKTSLLTSYPDDDNLDLALSLCQGRLSKAMQFLNYPIFKDLFDKAVSIIKFLQSSQDIARQAKELLDNKDNLKQIIEYVGVVLRDALCCLTGAPHLIISKAHHQDIINISQTYTASAIINILIRLPISLHRLATFGNVNSIVDQLMFLFLECKYNCRASI
jgi:DNA polymerase-3 subunit delta'